MKRAIIIVLDSAGCGALPDSSDYGDSGANTLGHIIEKSPGIRLPNLRERGLYNLLGLEKNAGYRGSFAKMSEKSVGKDTVIGHWELSGVVTSRALPTYPDGFPSSLIAEFEKKIGRKTIGNYASSGTEILEQLGDEHVRTGFPIVYTSADSVFQIAAHEEVMPVEELYRICRIARELLAGEHNVGRVIARPFLGKSKDYKRTTNRHDFALPPQKETILNTVHNNGGIVSAIGKISDIFVGSGVSESEHIVSNRDGILKTVNKIKEKKSGAALFQFIFTNLVDFDMVYGHRRDLPGYAASLEEFDSFMPELEKELADEDILFITADHGCDPSFTAHTDHTREYVPLFVMGKMIKDDNSMGILPSFADVAKTIADYFGLKNFLDGGSFLNKILKRG